MPTLIDQLRDRSFRVVTAIELMLPLPEDEIELRIELLESFSQPGQFRARLWRLEFYRLQSTFPQNQGQPSHEPSDEVILKEFESYENPLRTPMTFSSVDDALSYLLAHLANWLREQLGIVLTSGAAESND